MNCKHCNYVIDDDSYDVCPNCGKSLKEEPVEEVSDAIELPMKKTETPVELSKEDEFTASFIKKDDPLANIDKVKKETEKASTAMVISRFAAFMAVVFFAGVIYYTKFVMPKVQKEIQEAEQELRSGDNDPDYETTTRPKTSTGAVSIEAQFGEESIYNQLKKQGTDYTKELTDVDITLKYPEKVNGLDFDIILKREYNGGSYDDKVSFKYNSSSVYGIVRTYTNYNEDLITNIINSYVITKANENVVMYTKSSTFQLGNPTTILLFKDGTFDKIEKVITTYSTDGVSITQCPITINDNELSYCSVPMDFEKGKEVEIHKIKKPFGEAETVTDSLVGLVAK